MTQEEEPFEKPDEGLTDDQGFRLSELILNGPEDQYTIPLDQEVVRIGRGKGNDVVLKDPELPFVQCEIWKQRGHYVLIDKDSEGSTFVNGDPVEFHVLRPGDRIHVGDVSLTAVHAEQQEKPEPIDPEEAEAFFEEESRTEQATPTPGRRSVKKRNTLITRSRLQSSLWTWAVIGGILLMLGTGTWYAYDQYTNKKTARELLERAESLKEEQRYREALSLLSNQLLERDPPSEVAASGRTLQRTVQTIHNQKTRIRSRFNKLKSTVPPPESLSSEAKRKRIEETLDQINALLKKNERFLKRYFSTPAETETGPALLEQIRELKAKAMSHRKRLTQNSRDE